MSVVPGRVDDARPGGRLHVGEPARRPRSSLPVTSTTQPFVRGLRDGVEHARGLQQHAGWRGRRRGRLRGHGHAREQRREASPGGLVSRGPTRSLRVPELARVVFEPRVRRREPARRRQARRDLNRTRPPGGGRRTRAATPRAGSRHRRRGRRRRAARRAGPPPGRRRHRCDRCRRSESWRPDRPSSVRGRCRRCADRASRRPPPANRGRDRHGARCPYARRIRRTRPLEFDTTTRRQAAARSRASASTEPGATTSHAPSRSLNDTSSSMASSVAPFGGMPTRSRIRSK